MNPSTNSLKGFTNELDQLSYSENNKNYLGSGGLVSTFSDYSNFCLMLVNEGEFNGKKIISKESFQLMLEKHTEAFPNDDEPYLFPDLPGNYFAFNFSVLENTELDGDVLDGRSQYTFLICSKPDQENLILVYPTT